MQNNCVDELELYVIKRDGRKVPFNKAKIAVAIKKGFDSIREGEMLKYTSADANDALTKTLQILNEEQGKQKFKIEEIQDAIETALRSLGYEDVYLSYKEYRVPTEAKIDLQQNAVNKFIPFNGDTNTTNT